MNRNVIKTDGEKLIVVTDDAIYKSFFIIDRFVVERMSINVERSELMDLHGKIHSIHSDSINMEMNIYGEGLFTTTNESEFFAKLGDSYDREDLLKMMNAKLEDMK